MYIYKIYGKTFFPLFIFVKKMFSKLNFEKNAIYK